MIPQPGGATNSFPESTMKLSVTAGSQKYTAKSWPSGGNLPRCGLWNGRRCPSFLMLIPNGLNDPNHPEWGGWAADMSYTNQMISL